MLLDSRTLLVVAVVVALVSGLMGALVWQTKRSYPGRWVLGNLLAALALLLLRLRGNVADWISIVLANAMAICAGIAFLQGIRRFRGLRIAWWPECALGALTIAALSYFRYGTNDINARIIVMSLALGSIGIACGVILLKEMPRDRRTGLTITGLVFALAGVIQVVRGIYVFAFAPVTDLFDRSPSNTLFFLAASAGAVGWSLGFIVLTGEGLGTDSGGVFHRSAGDSTAASIPAFPKIVPEIEVRRQLQRVLESDVFRRSAQMERFLTLVVERSLLGHPEELKEYALGRDVFNRGDAYDPRADSIVRVEAQRLRRKLREYYESQGSGDPVIIDLPAGSYVPAFRYLQDRSIDEVQR